MQSEEKRNKKGKGTVVYTTLLTTEPKVAGWPSSSVCVHDAQVAVEASEDKRVPGDLESLVMVMAMGSSELALSTR